MGAILLDEQTAPGTPSTGQVVVYPKSDGNLYAKDDAGTETKLVATAASDTEAGILEIAVQSEQEAGSSTTLAVTPGRQHFHPSAAKFWVNFNGTGTAAIQSSHNVTSITDNGTGDYTVTIATDFSAATWSPYAFTSGDAVSQTFIYLGNTAAIALLAGTIRVNTATSSAAADRTLISVGGFGDQ